MFWKIIDIRANPYPPSFRRIVASTMDPAIGASTWALGNHRWVENIGSLTKNPNIVISQNIELIEKNDGKFSSEGIDISRWLEYKNMEQNITNIGKDAVIVYSIKYILACSRSGW